MNLLNPQKSGTGNVLSPAAILACLRANSSSTPSSNLHRTLSVPKSLAGKSEPASPELRKPIIIHASQTQANWTTISKSTVENSSELGREPHKIIIKDIRKGILVRKKERIGLTGPETNIVNRTADEPNRRSGPLRLFADRENPMGNESLAPRTRRSIKLSQDQIEEARLSETVNGTLESRKNKKVTFAFDVEETEIPERACSSMGKKMSRCRRAISNEREMNIACRNRAYRLITETLKQGQVIGPRIISENVSSSVSTPMGGESPLKPQPIQVTQPLQVREVRQPSREGENEKRLNGETAINSSGTAEKVSLKIETKELSLDQKYSEPLIKRSPFLKLPSILVNTPVKLSYETIHPQSLTDKLISTSPLKKEESIIGKETPIKPRATNIQSPINTSLIAERKPRSQNNFTIDRLRRKDDGFNINNMTTQASDSRLKISFQPTTLMNRTLKTEWEQYSPKGKEDSKKQVFSFIKKPQNFDLLTSIV